MKHALHHLIQATYIAILLTGVLEASSLKVYNMSERLLRGQTNPLSRCGKASDECAILPYQSIFNSKSVTYNLPGVCIKEFYWKGVIGPRYKITVNLQENEYAKLELYGDGGYKFKSKRIKYAYHG